MTKHFPSGDVMSIYDAAMRYQAEGRPLVVFAGKEYGTGSSRDWAAKGTKLLGVRAVVAESFERIHRSNLVGMGVLPLQFMQEGWHKLGLTGEEIVTIRGLDRPVAAQAADHRDLPPVRRPHRPLPGPLPHRYAHRARVLQERRRAELRPAQPGAPGGLGSRGPRRAGSRPPLSSRLVAIYRAGRVPLSPDAMRKAALFSLVAACPAVWPPSPERGGGQASRGGGALHGAGLRLLRQGQRPCRQAGRPAGRPRR